jgi:hypothetical protein
MPMPQDHQEEMKMPNDIMIWVSAVVFMVFLWAMLLIGFSF